MLLSNMKLLLICLISFITNAIFCQTELAYGENNKVYICYSSLAAAKSVNPDSVYGIILVGVKGIPKQLLQYKNLEYIYIGSKTRVNRKYYSKLNEREKKSVIPYLNLVSTLHTL